MTTSLNTIATAQRDPAAECLRVVFLGGVGEVGKNVLLLEYAEDIIVIDAGIGFPDEDLFGVDVLLPDLSYLYDRADRVRAIFITHGHEDHIGALPWLVDRVRTPIYATRLTAGLIQARLKARQRAELDLRILDPDADEAVAAGCFAVRCFHVCHSIPDAVGFVIETPVGTVVQTGDFKLDPTPVDGRVTDLERLAAIGRQRPLLLLSDCVHVESPGVTPSERVVTDTLDRVIGEAPGRVIVATFASSIFRIQELMTVAHRHRRRVACFGRSLQQNVRVALDLGYLRPPPGTLVRPQDVMTLPPDQVVCACTGSQGEPMAVLTRLAHQEHRELRVVPGDTVIISATPIPGNETAVHRVIDRLFEQGANVIYSARDLVHVSGHASQEELVTMLQAVQPQYVIPYHGEPRHLRLYKQLAETAGMDAERILVGRNGTMFAFDSTEGRIAGEVPTGTIFVGPGTAGELADHVLRDRRQLARDGVLFVSLSIDRLTRQVVGGPEVAGQGVATGGSDGYLLDALRAHLGEALRRYTPMSAPGADIGAVVTQVVQAFVFKETRRRPVVLPLVVEV